MLARQFTADYVISQHAWKEIMTKLNEMAKENRHIKQAVHKTYSTAAGVLGKANNKALTANPNDRINNHKQPNSRFREC